MARNEKSSPKSAKQDYLNQNKQMILQWVVENIWSQPRSHNNKFAKLWPAEDQSLIRIDVAPDFSRRVTFQQYDQAMSVSIRNGKKEQEDPIYDVKGEIEGLAAALQHCENPLLRQTRMDRKSLPSHEDTPFTATFELGTLEGHT